jgi:hypothetical protein
MAVGMVLNENRNLVRRELIYYLKVSDSQTGKELGRIGDIHIEGMLVLAPKPVPAQTVYKLLVELPKAMAQSEGYAELQIQARSLWSKPGPKSSNYCENGFCFLNLSAQAQRVIARLTEFFAMPG